jgi:hypothetical protein
MKVIERSNSQIGLEKWSAKLISVERPRTRAGVLQAVLSSADHESQHVRNELGDRHWLLHRWLNGRFNSTLSAVIDR